MPKRFYNYLLKSKNYLSNRKFLGEVNVDSGGGVRGGWGPAAQVHKVKHRTSAMFLGRHARILDFQPIPISFSHVGLQGLGLTSSNKQRTVFFGDSVAEISV